MIFQQSYDMISELDTLEKLMPMYKLILRKISLFIRNKLWIKSDKNKLAYFLHWCNVVYSAFIDAYGEDIGNINSYIRVLENNSKHYSKRDLSIEFIKFKADIQPLILQEMLKQHWKQINPYFKKDFVNDSMFEKNLIEILDDTFNNIVNICPEAFFTDLRNIYNICRCRDGVYHNAVDLLPPPTDIAIKLNIINRWNPPDKRYLYLAYGEYDQPYDTEFSINEYTCLLEKRAKIGTKYTISKFKTLKSSSFKQVFNLSYDDIEREDIFNIADSTLIKQTQLIIKEIMTSNLQITKENIMGMISAQDQETKKTSCKLCGQLLFKEMCEAIFVPLADEEDLDNELKEKCYKSFHILAEYFEDKGLAGIIYPSTRMKLKQISSKNLVLFNVDDVEPDVSTFKVVEFH